MLCVFWSKQAVQGMGLKLETPRPLVRVVMLAGHNTVDHTASLLFFLLVVPSQMWQRVKSDRESEEDYIRSARWGGDKHRGMPSPVKQQQVPPLEETKQVRSSRVTSFWFSYLETVFLAVLFSMYVLSDGVLR